MIFKIYSMLFHFASGLLGRNSDWKSGWSQNSRTGTLWFHASSAGELEILIPLIEKALENGRQACVSIFSSSAAHLLNRLPGELLFRGFSPEEADWESAFQKYGITECFTSKYEAWPGLWRAASLTGARINIVNAHSRSSLKWAKRMMTLFGVALPRLRFFVFDLKSGSELKKDFPEAEYEMTTDPRWLRVIHRSKNVKNHTRLIHWKNQFSHCPRPYWIIGSAWKEDMEFLSEEIREYPGTVWVVPHSLRPTPNFDDRKLSKNCILVDEMGILVELYSLADRIWVGGGFGKGIHSTLEPAVYQVPVACGPRRVEEFYETYELRSAGILTVCDHQEKLKAWMNQSDFHPTFNLESKLLGLENIMESLKS